MTCIHSKTVDDILKSRHELNTFHTFCTLIYSEENVTFMKDWSTIKQKMERKRTQIGSNPSLFVSELNVFLEAYFGKQSAYVLNISQETIMKARELQSKVVRGNEIDIPYEEITILLEEVNTHILALTAKTCIEPYNKYLNNMQDKINHVANTERTRVVII
eukprot:Awhi_evm1s6064